MQFHSSEKLRPQPNNAKSHYIKNSGNNSNVATPLAKLAEPTMTLKLLEAKITNNNSKTSEISLYGKVIYGSQEWNTNIENVLDYNPKWQESKTFILNHDVRKRSNSSQFTGVHDTIQKNSNSIVLNPEYVDILLYQKGLFNLFSDNEVGRVRLNLLELIKNQPKTDWFVLKQKKETKGSILISYGFERIQGIDFNPKNFKTTYCKLIGGIEENDLKAASRKNKLNNENITFSSHYRVQTENQESSQFKFNLPKNDPKIGCKTETSVLENEMINEDNSFDSQEEIQRKYDQIDKKEVGSLTDEWLERFEDLDENVTDEEFHERNESNDDEENWNNLFYTKQAFDLGNMAEILEIIKEENAQLKKREQDIKEDFEKLKIDYNRISKEKRLVDNKESQLTKRENCLKNEKKFLKNEFENFKNEQMELQKAIDSYKELNNYLDGLRQKENKIISNNLEMEEKILCISRANMYLPKALFSAKKGFLKNIMNNKISLYNSQSHNDNSVANLRSYYKSDKKEPNDRKSFVDLDEEYKQKLYQRMGLDGGFDLWQYWNQLRTKNKILNAQLENKKNDIEYMENRMKL